MVVDTFHLQLDRCVVRRAGHSLLHDARSAARREREVALGENGERDLGTLA